MKPLSAAELQSLFNLWEEYVKSWWHFWNAECSKKPGFNTKISLCLRIREIILHIIKTLRKAFFRTPMNQLKVWNLFWDLYILPCPFFSHVALKSILVSADKSPSDGKWDLQRWWQNLKLHSRISRYSNWTQQECKDRYCPCHVLYNLGEQPPKTINWWMHLKPWPQGKRSLSHGLAVEVSCPQWGSFLSKVTLLSLFPSLLKFFFDSSCSMWLETGTIKKGAFDYNKTKKPEVVLFSLKEDPVVGRSLESYNLDNLCTRSGWRKTHDNEFREHDHSRGQWEDTQLADPNRQFCLPPEQINKPQW